MTPLYTSIDGNLILIIEKPHFQLRDWMGATKKQGRDDPAVDA
jgi:hypothetical protein